MSEEKRPTVIVSGGFDPVHVGHIRMIREASKYGDVIVIANSDDWIYRNKGFNFMEFSSRHEILSSIKGVILVDSVDDSDDTVCKAIRRHKPTYFANGGNRKIDNTPEVLLCKDLGVKLLWGIGGDEKIFGTSELIQNPCESPRPPNRTVTKHSGR
jgi:D-beta-D-heptose 7-phosphate kinase/D-beta-D-heptose 1-phosphate adenosyltransferase|tara:strand:+ start:101 stop:568 length:468 start_codon:yes stop_codon:yes gene_type:complete